MKDRLPPTKKKQKPAGRVKQDRYIDKMEDYELKRSKKDNGRKKPMDIGDALNKSKEGYSKKPRVKPSKKRSYDVY